METFDTIMFQTHISEMLEEVAAVTALYPECKNYADVYDTAKLLTNKVRQFHKAFALFNTEMGNLPKCALLLGVKRYCHAQFCCVAVLQTILAHGVYLSDDELKILAARGSSISHCPNSNTSLKSGLCDVRRLLNAGVKVGLGTGRLYEGVSKSFRTGYLK
jgi:guanine deaminase